jgi:hypothetical protein
VAELADARDLKSENGENHLPTGKQLPKDKSTENE